MAELTREPVLPLTDEEQRRLQAASDLVDDASGELGADTTRAGVRAVKAQLRAALQHLDAIEPDPRPTEEAVTRPFDRHEAICAMLGGEPHDANEAEATGKMLDALLGHLSSCAPDAGPRFPIQGGASVPIWAAERAYATYARHYGTGQSLQRIAERGGFGLREFGLLYAGLDPSRGDWGSRADRETAKAVGDVQRRDANELRAQLAAARARVADLEERWSRVMGLPCAVSECQHTAGSFVACAGCYDELRARALPEAAVEPLRRLLAATPEQRNAMVGELRESDMDPYAAAADLLDAFVLPAALAPDPAAEEPPTCRGCSECAGEKHHWLTTEVILRAPCKHCQATTALCAMCGEVPVQSDDAVCSQCAPEEQPR